MTNFIITLRKHHFESKLFVNDKKPFLNLFLQQEMKVRLNPSRPLTRSNFLVNGVIQYFFNFQLSLATNIGDKIFD